ncbi:E3 ubiquitin-protein ligase WAV3-like [Aristolochia californica]|uniref:E3 ubiquitin-protein ligase WAV3-like n=1 Tax=Aristolochia californica TaxID=171875 RepID=UPI0035D97307
MDFSKEMASKWRKAKLALGMNLCVYVPRTDDEASSSVDLAGRLSDAVSVSSPSLKPDSLPITPTTPIPSSSGLRLAKIGSRSSKKTCAICLGTMKPGQGHAIFTAECSHAFHFHCIASNVKHGNQICPVCRAKWKEIPFQRLSMDHGHGRARVNPVDWGAQDNNWTTVLRRLPSPRVDSNRQIASLFHASEPSVFDDDEPLDPRPESSDKGSQYADARNSNSPKTMEVKTYTEFSALTHSILHENFAVLIHLKAPFTSSSHCSSRNHSNPPVCPQPCRAPVDLVTVLDVSGSMAGTKLALLKRAMGFVIQNLGPSDRLSVIAFSSTARRLFPLRRMSDSGRQQALQAVNSLISNGGTNIAEGLKKGAKVMEDRKDKNPVPSIILLSDGQDTYTVTTSRALSSRPDYQSLLPSSVCGGAGSRIPVHVFGFGVDHDAASMHSISETSGGTFSFIEAEGVIQDAFAQCIGGLLSVVVQELHVAVDCVSPGVKIASVKAGSYVSSVSNEGRSGSIEVGNLYAEEERDFLLYLDVPAGDVGQVMPLVKVGCVYKDPISKETLNLDGKDVTVQRLDNVIGCAVSIEVDRQRNRLHAAETMAEARTLAEHRDLGGAVDVLENQRRALSGSASAQSGDQLCVALDAELKEMQERMASRRVYEASGRAYVLSGLSSHSWQRATTRGDSTESASLVHAYQTPSMVDMLARSQTMCLETQARPPVRPARSFTQQPQPR